MNIKNIRFLYYRNLEKNNIIICLKKKIFKLSYSSNNLFTLIIMKYIFIYYFT